MSKILKSANLPFSESPPFKIISKLSDLKVPKLSYDLSKVFKDQSRAHFVRNPETLRFNLDHRLYDISKSKNFDTSKLSGFIKPSQDVKLKAAAIKNNCKYFASTSSITQILQILQYSWSDWRLNTSRFSEELQTHSQKFVASFSKIQIIDLKYDSDLDIYGINQGQKSHSTILSEIGHSLEKFLTSSPEEYETYLFDPQINNVNSESLSQPCQPLSFPKDVLGGDPKQNNDGPEDLSYHYSEIYGFLLRAQLDCINPDLPRKTFDLKTRAVSALRLTQNVDYSRDYHINKFKGFYESFEREDYDLLRSALLKYGLQSRIGNMDGILIAYHNSSLIFGFQYFSQEKLDEWLYGSSEIANACFDMSLKVLKLVLDEIVNMFPKQDLKIYMGTGANHEVSFAIESEGGKVTQYLSVLASQKKDNKSIRKPVDKWTDLSVMSMDISIKKGPKEMALNLIKKYQCPTQMNFTFPAAYFYKSYAAFKSL